MKAIRYTQKLSYSIVHLIYCACTNDMFVNSKQTNVLEHFFIALVIEFNTLFIADTLLMKVLKKHLFVEMNFSIASQKQILFALLAEYKNAFSDVFNANNYKFNKINKLTMFE